MADNIPVHYSRQFTTGIELLAQQRDSRLRGAVRVEPLNSADRTSFDQIGVIEMTERTVRDADTVLSSPPHVRRWVTPKRFDVNALVDRLDTLRTLNNPTNPYVVAFGAAFGRRQDQSVIDSAFVASTTGNDGSATTAFPAAFQIAAGAAGLTLVKIITARKLMKQAEEVGPFHFVFNQEALEDILNDPTITSADYNSVRLLMSGELDSFMGFKWNESELLGLTGVERRLIAFSQGALLLGILEDGRATIANRADKNNIPQVSYETDLGATRMNETGVVEVLITE